jgi:hypothetical protein
LLTVPVLGLQAPNLWFGAARVAWSVGSGALAPAVGLRVASAAAWRAGVAATAVTNVGAQLDVGPLRLEYAFDPAARRGVVVLVASLVPAFSPP